MKTRIIALVCFFSICIHAHTQKKHDYNWLFGYGGGVPDSNRVYGGIIMSFNKGKINFIPQDRAFDFYWQTNSFSNNHGELLLMSNGCSIADSEGNILENGDSISYGKIWAINCPISQPSVQAGTFINFRQNDSTIIFLHTILDTIDKELKLNRKAILESKIALFEDTVFSKNLKILYSRLISDGFTAIPNDNFESWWIIAPQKDVDRFWIILYNHYGVVKSLNQKIGIKHDSISSGGGQGIFSPNGKKYAIYRGSNGLQVFDFDRNTGILTNFRYYLLPYPYSVISGCAFSPDSRFVYISNPTEVIQVDLLEQDSSKAIDTVGMFDNFFDPYPATYKQMALGPDCRIYITAGDGNQYLHVILYPNRKGKDCQLINRGLKLPTRNSHATPNFPHYRVDEPYPCDSTIRIQLNTDIDETFKFRQGELLLYPNPAKSELIVHDIKQIITGKVNIRLLNMQGQLVFETQQQNNGEEIHIPVGKLTAGMYFIQMRNGQGKYWTDKFVKE